MNLERSVLLSLWMTYPKLTFEAADEPWKKSRRVKAKRDVMNFI